jgi:queuine tRNA-ribosyltransferase
MEVQIALGADICMAFDECTEYPADRQRAQESLRLTMAWARRSLDQMRAHGKEVVWRDQFEGRTQSLFGIVQGGTYADLRRESAERLVEMDFDGYAIGGLSVGEPRNLTLDMIAEVLPLLPPGKPRYVMGVGYPDEIEQYARMGVDMMDCVLPTRAARHGLLFTSEGRLNIKNKRYAEDQGPPDPACTCMVCRRYSRAYLRHLMQCGEALSGTLNTIHNLLPGHHGTRPQEPGLRGISALQYFCTNRLGEPARHRKFKHRSLCGRTPSQRRGRHLNTQAIPCPDENRLDQPRIIPMSGEGK